MSNLHRSATAALIVLLAAATAAAEDFDAAGTSWVDTIFPDLLAAGDGTFVREVLSAGLGAPDTGPVPLPINVDGDKEGRYHEVDLAPTGSYAFMADLPENDLADSTMDGYVAIGNPDPFGNQTVAFVLRGSVSPQVNGYAALLSHSSGATTATLRLARIRDNIVGAGADSYALSEAFDVDLDQENYHLRFSASGNDLAASLWRVQANGGSVIETPIDLLPDPGVQNTITARDGELASGRAGTRAFCRGGNSIFWDDVQVTSGTCPGPGCPGDLDCDGAVGTSDLLLLLASWNQTDVPADLDGGGVGTSDLLILLASWGPCP